MHMHDSRRMGEARYGLGLIKEPAAPPGEIVGHLSGARQNRNAIDPHSQQRRQVLLQSDIAIKLQVGGTIGDPESALAKHRFDPVSADPHSSSQCRVVFGPVNSAGLGILIVVHRFSSSHRSHL